MFAVRVRLVWVVPKLTINVIKDYSGAEFVKQCMMKHLQSEQLGLLSGDLAADLWAESVPSGLRQTASRNRLLSSVFMYGQAITPALLMRISSRGSSSRILAAKCRTDVRDARSNCSKTTSFLGYQIKMN